MSHIMILFLVLNCVVCSNHSHIQSYLQLSEIVRVSRVAEDGQFPCCEDIRSLSPEKDPAGNPVAHLELLEARPI